MALRDCEGVGMYDRPVRAPRSFYSSPHEPRSVRKRILHSFIRAHGCASDHSTDAANAASMDYPNSGVNEPRQENTEERINAYCQPSLLSGG